MSINALTTVEEIRFYRRVRRLQVAIPTSEYVLLYCLSTLFAVLHATDLLPSVTVAFVTLAQTSQNS